MESDLLVQLVDEFAEAVCKQKDSIRRGDTRAGNRYAKKYVAAFRKLRSFGNDGRDALASLLYCENLDVRVMAAAFLLRYKNKEALKILREAAVGKGLAAFGASEALKRWEENDWSLDPGE